jgi:hypothetical protein
MVYEASLRTLSPRKGSTRIHEAAELLQESDSLAPMDPELAEKGILSQ